MLPSRCPHCQAELPKLGRFCVMCGRRVEGWRGLMPAGDPELGASEADGADGLEDLATPREIASSEEQTRPIRPSQNLAAVAASARDEDHESRKPTGEVPSLGHELRAKAPDQRVHTSPIGNILPTDVLETLDEAVAVNSGRASRSGDAHRPARLRAASPSGPSRADRTPSTPIRPAARPEPAEERADSRGERRRPTARPRRTARAEFPALAPHRLEPAADESEPTPDRAAPRRASNAPMPVGPEPTHFIPRRQPTARLLGVLRLLMWGLLWLGLGGMVAFSVVVLYRRSHPPVVSPTSGPGPKPVPTAPPRRSPSATKVAPRPAVANSAALPTSPTQARDLVVPIPAGGRPPLLPATSATPPGPLPAASGVGPAAVPEPPAPPLDPKERAAAEQTMSNIEFVVSERVAQVRACYDRAVRSAGPDAPAGRVEVSLTLTDEGLAQSVITVGNTVGSAQLAGCLEQRIAEWHFPRPLGTARTFRLPFTFSPSPEQSGPRPKR